MHTATTKECAKAQGQDRHLYALMCLWQRTVDAEAESDQSSIDDNSVNDYSSPSQSEYSNPASPRGNSSVVSDEDDGLKVTATTSRVTNNPRSTIALPAIFADAGWDKLNNTILSTSNCGNPSLRHFGFGPTSGEGFGIGYIIQDGSISICASSKHRQTKRFIDAIESYFLEIRKLLRMTQRRGTSIDKGASRAREAEEKFGRSKNRGKAIADTGSAGGGKREQQDNAAVSSDDDDMGGCKFSLLPPDNDAPANKFSIDGFFDAGMLMQALKAKESGDQRPSEKVVQRREVGKKLRLMEY
jgi:carnitine O-acetyltransferase